MVEEASEEAGVDGPGVAVASQPLHTQHETEGVLGKQPRILE